MAPRMRNMIAVALLVVLGACANGAPKTEVHATLVWPDVPNPPRIAYVKAFSRPENFGIVKGFFQRMVEVIVGRTDARLVRPMAVLEAGGSVYVADPGANGVHRFDTASARYDLILAAGEAPLPSPVGLARGSAGEVYVADSELGQVFVIRPGAKSAVPLALPVLGQPTGIAFDAAADRLYVTDTTAHRVNAYRRDGSLEFSIGGRGKADGEFNFPTLIWLDGLGQLYVTDSLNFRIQIFDGRGRFLSKFGQAGDGSGDNMRPKSVATDSYGHIYVVDALQSAVQIFDRTGRHLLSVGGIGADPGEFWLPAGIFIDENNVIYIADSYNQRVQVLRYIGGPT